MNRCIALGTVRDNARQFAARNVNDGKRASYWTADDGTAGAEVVLEFKKPVTFNIVRLREYLPLGQRVDAFALD